jgi:hypothetical protein
MEINEERMNQFMHQAICDLGATAHAAMVLIGEKLGLYKFVFEAKL